MFRFRIFICAYFSIFQEYHFLYVNSVILIHFGIASSDLTLQNELISHSCRRNDLFPHVGCCVCALLHAGRAIRRAATRGTREVAAPSRAARCARQAGPAQLREPLRSAGGAARGPPGGRGRAGRPAGRAPSRARRRRNEQLSAEPRIEASTHVQGARARLPAYRRLHLRRFR